MQPVNRSTEMLHPLLKKDVDVIQSLIRKHRLPIRLFETGRDHDRQQWLLKSGKMKVPTLGHLYDLVHDPPLYTTAVAYVMHTGTNWSWNLRDSTVTAFYNLFGNLVLDACPNLEWGGNNRKAQDYTLFTMKSKTIYDNLDITPCVLPG